MKRPFSTLKYPAEVFLLYDTLIVKPVSYSVQNVLALFTPCCKHSDHILSYPVPLGRHCSHYLWSTPQALLLVSHHHYVRAFHALCQTLCFQGNMQFIDLVMWCTWSTMRIALAHTSTLSILHLHIDKVSDSTLIVWKLHWMSVLQSACNHLMHVFIVFFS